MLEAAEPNGIKNLFDDVNYAWRLLEAQISLQMSPDVSGQQIAKLLQLYMKGVQKMNSVSDYRQSYFKNKVTSLMTKQTVIKSLKKNPMKKKVMHQEVSCKIQKNTTQTLKQNNQNNKMEKQKSTINHIELKEKQKQFEMRIAYTAQQSNPDALRKLMLQQQCRQQNLSKKINNIMQSHEERLNQRIKMRKLRTATYRTQSQYNQQSQTQPSTNKFKSNKKQQMYFPVLDITKQSFQQLVKINIKQKRISKSLQKCFSFIKIDQSFMFTKKRKYTLDII